MSTLEIKGGMYELISKVNDKELLIQMYELIGEIVTQNLSQTDFWDELSDEEKVELDQAIEESFDDTNLIPHNKVTDKYTKWLNK